MSEANGDPEVIREFARALEQFCNDTQEGMRRLQSILTEMGSSTWTDEKYRQYNEAFETSANALYHVVGEIQPEQIQRLNNLAQKLEDYLSGGY